MIGCTVVATRDSARALVLAESFLANNPGSRFVGLFVEGVPEDLATRAGAEWLEPEALGSGDFHERAFAGDFSTLSASLKATLLRSLLSAGGGEAAIYLGPETYVLDSFRDVESLLEASAIVFVPRLIDASPESTSAEFERRLLTQGALDPDFVALVDGDETRRFLYWWESRTRHSCFQRPDSSRIPEALWLGYASAHFSQSAILRDPRFNVGPARKSFTRVEERDEGFFVDDRPVATLQTRGLETATGVFPRETRLPGSKPLPPSTRHLLERYLSLLDRAGHGRFRRSAYAFDSFSDGRRIHPLLREIYKSLAEEERRSFGDPFESGREGGFLPWARTAPRAGALSPFLRAVYESRPDVMAAFPQAEGEDHAEFLRWARETAPREMHFDADMANPNS